MTSHPSEIPPTEIELLEAELRAENPGPDGIRAGLVEHVKQLIALDKYDTPERWAAAQERLFQHILDSRS